MSNDIFWADVTNFICPYCHTLKRATVGLFGSDGRPHVWCDHCGKFTWMVVKNPVEITTGVAPHCCITGCQYEANFMVADVNTGEKDFFCKTHWGEFIRNFAAEINNHGD